MPAPTARIHHLIDVERWADARRELAGPLREAPEDPHLLFLAALVEHGAGRADEARRLVQETLARHPSHSGARHLNFRLLLAERRHVEAEQVVLELLREEPEEPFWYACYARLMLTTLHVAKARGLVDEALRLDPSDPSARLLDALVSVVEGRLDGAEARVAELVRDAPDGEAVARTLVVVLASRGRYAEVLEIARELLRVRPGDPDLVDVLVEMRAVTHWTSRPLLPFVRFGWGGVIALWAAAAFGLAALRPVAPALAGWLGTGYLAFVAYSWVHLPLLRRWLRWRGF